MAGMALATARLGPEEPDDELVMRFAPEERLPLQDAPGTPAEPVLAAWGIDTDGRPVFVGLAQPPQRPPTPGTTSVADPKDPHDRDQAALVDALL